MAEKKAQLSLEALVSAAALLSFLSILAVATSDFSAKAQSSASSLQSQSTAELFALELGFHAADTRLTTFSTLELGNCSLLPNGIRCGNSSAETIANSTGGETYEFFQSLPA